MYCTIHSGPPSTALLAPDAREAHAHLSRHAAALGGLSASFATEALAVADAYTVALACGTRDDWAAFVSATAVIAGHGASVAAMVQLSPRERDATRYFAQIVRENDDLLAAAGRTPA